MVGAGAIASLTVRRANTVSILRDLKRRPMELGKSGDQPRDDAGLAYAPRMPANYDNRHLSSQE